MPKTTRKRTRPGKSELATKENENEKRMGQKVRSLVLRCLQIVRNCIQYNNTENTLNRLQLNGGLFWYIPIPKYTKWSQIEVHGLMFGQSQNFNARLMSVDKMLKHVTMVQTNVDFFDNTSLRSR